MCFISVIRSIFLEFDTNFRKYSKAFENILWNGFYAISWLKFTNFHIELDSPADIISNRNEFFNTPSWN